MTGGRPRDAGHSAITAAKFHSTPRLPARSGRIGPGCASYQTRCSQFCTVMPVPGTSPGISRASSAEGVRLDGRAKPGHDNGQVGGRSDINPREPLRLFPGLRLGDRPLAPFIRASGSLHGVFGALAIDLGEKDTANPSRQGVGFADRGE